MMRQFLRNLSIGFALGLGCFAGAVAQTSPVSPIYLYGVEFTRPDQPLKIARETFDAIGKAVAPRPLIVNSVKLDELEQLVNSGKADIVITTSGIYRRHVQNGMRDIATLITAEQPDPDHAIGTLVVARKGSGLKSLDDLHGKILASNHPMAFQGTLTLKKELFDKGYDPEKFFGNILYLGMDRSKRYEAVLSGTADATICAVCLMERASGREKEILAQFEPVGATRDPHTGCLTSTKLYPNHTLLISPGLDVSTIRQIAEAVYRLPKNADGQHWMLASDFSAGDALYRDLRIGPYEHLRSWTLGRIWNEFGLWILALLATIAFAVWHVIRTGKLIQLATQELREALQREQRMSARIRELTEKYENTRRAVTVSSLSNVVAHELGQPLSAILFYARSIRKLVLEKAATHRYSPELIVEAIDEMTGQTMRATDIVNLVRGYAKAGKEPRQKTDLVKLTGQVIENFIFTHEDAARMILFEPQEKTAFALLSVIEYELALSNLLKNSFESLVQAKVKKPCISVGCSLDGERITITVCDNGPGLPDSRLAQLNDPVVSLKKEGLGLGLSIVRAIVTSNDGQMKISKASQGGLCVELVFARLTQEDGHGQD